MAWQDEIGSDVEIYTEEDGGSVAGDVEIEVGRAKAKERKGGSGETRRGIALLPATTIAAGATENVTPALNRPIKPLGMRIEAPANAELVRYAGATHKGIPLEGSAGVVSVSVFARQDLPFWDWPTINPNDTFYLSFTNTHSAGVTITGFLYGYLA